MKWQDVLQEQNFGFSYSSPGDTEKEGNGLGSGAALHLPGRHLSLTLSSACLLYGSGIIYNGVFKGDFQLVVCAPFPCRGGGGLQHCPAVTWKFHLMLLGWHLLSYLLKM